MLKTSCGFVHSTWASLLYKIKPSSLHRQGTPGHPNCRYRPVPKTQRLVSDRKAYLYTHRAMHMSISCKPIHGKHVRSTYLAFYTLTPSDLDDCWGPQYNDPFMHPICPFTCSWDQTEWAWFDISSFLLWSPCAVSHPEWFKRARKPSLLQSLSLASIIPPSQDMNYGGKWMCTELPRPTTFRPSSAKSWCPKSCFSTKIQQTSNKHFWSTLCNAPVVSL